MSNLGTECLEAKFLTENIHLNLACLEVFSVCIAVTFKE